MQHLSSSEKDFFIIITLPDLWSQFKLYMYPNSKTCIAQNYHNSKLAAAYGYLGLMKTRPNRDISYV